MADVTVTIHPLTSYQVVCDDDEWSVFIQAQEGVDTKEAVDSQVVGHLIVVHGMTKVAAVAEATRWTLENATAEAAP